MIQKVLKFAQRSKYFAIGLALPALSHAQVVTGQFEGAFDIMDQGALRHFDLARPFMGSGDDVVLTGYLDQYDPAFIIRESDGSQRIVVQKNQLMPDESGNLTGDRCDYGFEVLNYFEGRLLFKCYVRPSAGGQSRVDVFQDRQGVLRRVMAGVSDSSGFYAFNNNYFAAIKNTFVVRVDLNPAPGQNPRQMHLLDSSWLSLIRLSPTGTIALYETSVGVWKLTNEGERQLLVRDSSQTMPGDPDMRLTVPRDLQFNSQEDVIVLADIQRAGWLSVGLVRIDHQSSALQPLLLPVADNVPLEDGLSLSFVSNFTVAPDDSIYARGPMRSNGDPWYATMSKYALLRLQTDSSGNVVRELLARADRAIPDDAVVMIPADSVEYGFRASGRPTISGIINLPLRPNSPTSLMSVGTFKVDASGATKLLAPGDRVPGSETLTTTSARSISNGRGEVLLITFVDDLANNSRTIRLREDGTLVPFEVHIGSVPYPTLTTLIGSDGRIVVSSAQQGNQPPQYAIVNLRESSPMCDADIDGSGALGSQDIFDFLAAWYARNETGDFNHDGQTSIQDLFDFLERFMGGCGNALHAPDPDDLPEEFRHLVQQMPSPTAMPEATATPSSAVPTLQPQATPIAEATATAQAKPTAIKKAKAKSKVVKAKAKKKKRAKKRSKR